MKNVSLLLGSSLLGLAVMAASAAVAADDVAVEQGAAVAAGAGDTAAPAEAEGDKPRGLYLGGALGLSVWEGGKTSGLWDPSYAVTDTGSEEDFLWSIFAGYRLTDWLGAEVGWTDLGGFSASGIQDKIENKTEISVDGLELRLRLWHSLGMDRLGLEGLTAIGGIGAYFYSTDVKTTYHAAGFDTIDPSDDSGQALTLSLGLQYQIIDHMLVRTEYQRFFDVDKQNVDTVFASVVVGFYDLFGQGKPGGGGDMGGIVVE